MERKPARVLRAADIVERRKWYSQRLNPRSRFRGTMLGGVAGLQRVGVNIAWLPPGQESFAYHAHRVEEEWIYILSGRGISVAAGEEVEVGPGDFVAFPAPQVPHILRNPFAEELVYLMGGDGGSIDIIDYPGLAKSYLLVGGEGRAAFYELNDPEYPFGPADEEEPG